MRIDATEIVLALTLCLTGCAAEESTIDPVRLASAHFEQGAVQFFYVGDYDCMIVGMSDEQKRSVERFKKNKEFCGGGADLNQLKRPFAESYNQEMYRLLQAASKIE